MGRKPAVCTMGGAIIRRFALFPLMLLMLLLLPTCMVAQTDYDTSVTLKELAGNPEGNTNETYANLFDGKKTNSAAMRMPLKRFVMPAFQLSLMSCLKKAQERLHSDTILTSPKELMT